MMSKMAHFTAFFLLISAISAREPSFGRVSIMDGDAMVYRVAEGEWGYCTLNMLVEEGDIIKTGYDARLEIQLERGALLRIDSNTRLKFSEISYVPEADEEDVTVKLYYGSVSISVPGVGGNSYFMLEGDGVTLTLAERTVVRVDYPGGEDFYVYVKRGEAQLTTAYETKYLRKGRAAKAVPEGYIVELRRKPPRDDFERWCRDLDREYRETVRDEHLPLSIYIGYSELSGYGRWTFAAGIGWVWVPYVDAGWRPYRHGRWVWTLHWGWVWVPFEPWGFVPYHYGRWAYVAGIGWVWVPGPVWGPGWVAWAWGPGWIAWVPLDPWDRPLVYIDIDVWYCVDYNSFLYPIYRYKRPHHGVYPDPGYKPYRTSPPKPGHWKKTPPKVTPVGSVIARKKDTTPHRWKNNKVIPHDHREKKKAPHREKRKSSIETEKRKGTHRHSRVQKVKTPPDRKIGKKSKPRPKHSVEKAKEFLSRKFNPLDFLRKRTEKDSAPRKDAKKRAFKKPSLVPIKLDITKEKRR